MEVHMKPNNIMEADWRLIKEKYKDNLDYAIEKLNNNYPVQYLIGYVDFYNMRINVDERALIPRYETEELVSKVIDRIKELDNPRVIDLGCGSGCIAIAIQKNTNSLVSAVDISKDAINLAKENALLNKVDINFINKKIEDVSLDGYDVIVSNPPYVCYDDEVGAETKYEPSIALYANESGTYYYRIIMEKVSKLLNKPSLIAFEIGYLQANKLTNLANTLLKEYDILIEKDLALKNRFMFLSKKKGY